MAWQERIALLQRVFDRIACTRMQGLPMLHPELQVEAVGFAPQVDAEAGAVLGILITPWFMNLIWLADDGTPALAAGKMRMRTIGGERFEFIGADEASFGRYEMCSLFSPMFEFSDHAAARATAVEVLRVLRMPAAPVVQLPAIPGRRAFLTGRVRPQIGAKR